MICIIVSMTVTAVLFFYGKVINTFWTFAIENSKALWCISQMYLLCIYFCKLHTHLLNISALSSVFCRAAFLEQVWQRSWDFFFFLHHLDHGLETPVKQKILFPVKGVVIIVYDKKLNKYMRFNLSFYFAMWRHLVLMHF